MRKIRVFVDKGHGGTDSGAIGGGMTEAKINSNVADFLKAELESMGFDVLVSQPRTGYKLGLAERIQKAFLFRADISISVHHNAGGGIGSEVICEFDDPQSKRLAILIGREFEKLTKFRGVKIRVSSDGKRNYFALLNIINCINIISEFCFLDNPFDVKKIDTLAEQKAEAKSIATAINEFRKEMK